MISFGRSTSRRSASRCTRRFHGSNKKSLAQLEAVLDFLPPEPDVERAVKAVPGDLIEGLKRGIAGQMISCWVQLRTCEVVLEEIARELSDVDPLKPPLRAELDETKRELVSLQAQLEYLRMEVVLRDPLEEELEEMRAWVREQAK
jgi:hypothetical protein